MRRDETPHPRATRPVAPAALVLVLAGLFLASAQHTQGPLWSEGAQPALLPGEEPCKQAADAASDELLRDGTRTTRLHVETNQTVHLDNRTAAALAALRPLVHPRPQVREITNWTRDVLEVCEFSLDGQQVLVVAVRVVESHTVSLPPWRVISAIALSAGAPLSFEELADIDHRSTSVRLYHHVHPRSEEDALLDHVLGTVRNGGLSPARVCPSCREDAGGEAAEAVSPPASGAVPPSDASRGESGRSGAARQR